MATATSTSPTKLPVLYAIDFQGWGETEKTGPNVRAISWDKSRTIITTGPKGNGKSLVIATLAAQAMIEGLEVVSNMPIAFRCVYENRYYKDLYSTPLEMMNLLKLNGKYKGRVILIDEIRRWLSNRKWSSKRNELLNEAINQLRKDDLTILASCKNVRRLDQVFREDELDIEIKCRDANNFNSEIPPGTEIKMTWYDISGGITGNEAEEKPPFLETTLDMAERVWAIYNSFQVQDYWETMKELKFDFGKKKFNPFGDDEDDEEDTGAYVTQHLDETISRLISAFEKKRNRLSGSEFWNIVQLDYHNTQHQKIAFDIMEKLGITKDQRGYKRDYDLINN